MSLIADESHNHAVEVEEEHQEVETQLDERFLLVHIQLAENLGRIQQVLVVVDLLRIEGEEGQVQDNRKPVAIDHEEEGQESVDGSFGDDVGVETVAQVDRIDVVTLEIAVHNGEKHLKEEVDGIDQYRQQIQPRFTRHDGQIRNALAWKVSKKVERFEK